MRDQNNRSGNAISIRYHQLYQESQIVQAKTLQIIYSNLGVLQLKKTELDRYKCRLQIKNTRQPHQSIRVDQDINEQTRTVEVSGSINN